MMHTEIGSLFVVILHGPIKRQFAGLPVQLATSDGWQRWTRVNHYQHLFDNREKEMEWEFHAKMEKKIVKFVFHGRKIIWLF